MPRRAIPLSEVPVVDGRSFMDYGTYGRPVYQRAYGPEGDMVTGVGGTDYYYYRDDLGNYWQEVYHPDGTFELLTTKRPGDPFAEWREAEEGEEPMGYTKSAQEKPPDDPLIGRDFGGGVLGGGPTSIADPDEPDETSWPLPRVDPRLAEPTAEEREAEAEEEARRDHALDPYRGDQQRAEELERAEEAQGSQNPPGDDDGGGVTGPGVPYQDYLPFLPMVQDPTTGEWRNAEPGEIPEPPVEQSPAAEPPVLPTAPGGTATADASGGDSNFTVGDVNAGGNTGNAIGVGDTNAGEILDPIPSSGPSPFGDPPPDPTPAGGEGEEAYQTQEAPPLQFGNTGNLQNAGQFPTPPGGQGEEESVPQWDGDGNGIPGEYGDGPDLDANGVPDEIGINPDSLQPGYPDYSSSTSGDWGGVRVPPSTSGEWGGVEVPDPTVPPSDASADGLPDDYGGGSTLEDGNWVPDETAIDPYSGSSDPYGVAPEEALPEEPSAPEGEDPSVSGSF